MNRTSLTLSQEAEALPPLDTRLARILAEPGNRAAMVFREGSGFIVRPIEHGKSVVNLQRDLLLHLNEVPLEDAWLEVLRDYCDARLNARAEARGTGRIMTPRVTACWDMMDLAAQPPAGEA